VKPGAETGNPYGPWTDHVFVVFDVETTGLQESDRVIEVGLARFERGQCVARFGSLLYPDMEIPQEATAIHGISTADVASAPRFAAVLPEVLRIARDAWPVAYNASFDHGFWTREVARTQVADLQVPIFDPRVKWLDPLTWVRHIDGIWAKNKLTVACERWGIPIETAHRATDDAVAAGKLLVALAERLPPWTITELLRRQEEIHLAQDQERRAWYAKKGIPYR